MWDVGFNFLEDAWDKVRRKGLASRMARGPQQFAASRSDAPLWLNYGKCGEEFSKIVRISGQQGLMALGKCADDGSPGGRLLVRLQGHPHESMADIMEFDVKA